MISKSLKQFEQAIRDVMPGIMERHMRWTQVRFSYDVVAQEATATVLCRVATYDGSHGKAIHLTPGDPEQTHRAISSLFHKVVESVHAQKQTEPIHQRVELLILNILADKRRCTWVSEEFEHIRDASVSLDSVKEGEDPVVTIESADSQPWKFRIIPYQHCRRALCSRDKYAESDLKEQISEALDKMARDYTRQRKHAITKATERSYVQNNLAWGMF